jgi:hypothetical protein
MIDITYVIINVIASTFNNIFASEIPDIWADFSAGLPWDPLRWFIPGSFKASPLTKPLIDALVTINASLSILNYFTVALFGIFSIIVTIIIAILSLIAVLRCLWTLLKAFTMIIVNLVFAPFRLLMGAFPGSDAISSWFKDLAANLAVLPAMIVIFYLASFFILAGVPREVYDNWYDFFFRFTLPLISTLPPETLTRVIFPYIGLAFLLLAPKVADMIQSFITKKPFAYGTALGEYGTMAYRIGMAGWQKYQEVSGRAAKKEAYRKLKAEAEVKKEYNL